MDESDTILSLHNERIVIPELLFHPSDVGLAQAGVVEAIQQSLSACPEPVRAALLSSVLLIGAGAQFANLAERVHDELRASVDADIDVRVQLAAQPAVAAWRGGVAFARQPYATRLAVDAKTYREEGCARMLLP